jgi:hypothetical protein
VSNSTSGGSLASAIAEVNSQALSMTDLRGLAAELSAAAAMAPPKSFAKKFKANVSAGYDAGTKSEAEMQQEVSLSNRIMERAVIRLQRIRRIYSLRRAVKKVWRREYATITLQRATRGLFGRLYVALYRKLRPVAAQRVKAVYLRYKSRQIRKVWHALVLHLSRRVLPLMKRFLRNCYLSWVAKREASVLCIQRAMRYYLEICSSTSLTASSPRSCPRYRLWCAGTSHACYSNDACTPTWCSPLTIPPPCVCNVFSARASPEWWWRASGWSSSRASSYSLSSAGTCGGCGTRKECARRWKRTRLPTSSG